MKVKCIKKYFDKELNKLIDTNHKPFEVSDERGAVLLDAGVVEEVKAEEKPEEKKATEKPKTRRKKGE